MTRFTEQIILEDYALQVDVYDDGKQVIVTSQYSKDCFLQLSPDRAVRLASALVAAAAVIVQDSNR